MKALIFSLLLAMLSFFETCAQGKYFKVVIEPYSSVINDKYYGHVVPVDDRKDGNAILQFSGKTKEQLYKAVMEYLKARPRLILKEEATTPHLITYRNFSAIGSMDSCFADLSALTYVYAIPEDGLIKVSFGMGSKIFATIFKAQLQITPDDNVASIDDRPFNEYKFVQPADVSMAQSRSAARTMLIGSIGGAKRVKMPLKSAYPDSIFDPEGNVVNPVNKRIIEKYYDRFVEDLNSYLLSYFRR